MRSLAIGISVILALWLGYAAGPFLAVYRLVDAVQARDVAALTERVDFPALRASLAAQIVRTYLRITGKAGRPGSLLEQFAVGIGTSIVDPIVSKVISPQGLLGLLQNGRPPTMENGPSIEGLSSEALRNLWRVYLNSELGIGRFFVIVPVDKPAAESFRLQFCLRGWTWKLCGIEIPEELQVRLAQEIVKSEQR
jgi:hypothetical protein